MNDHMIGLIPAAGKGVRLGLPYPKELYPVISDRQYKPVAEFVLDNLRQAGLKHIVFVVNEAKHQLIGYFGGGRRFGCDVTYAVQEARGDSNHSSSPGLAHALDSAYHLTAGKTVFFGMADTIMQPENVFDRLRAESAPEDDLVLALFETDRPEKFGMVDVRPDGKVTAIVDKPEATSLTHMWGCIVWSPRFTEHLHQCVEKGISDFAHIMNTAITDGMNAKGVRMSGGSYIDLGTYDEIVQMEQHFINGGVR